jgi:hypothetical protein
LNPLLPALTLLSSPDAATVSFTSSSARRSSRSPTPSLFFSPIQIIAGPAAVSVRFTS